MVGIEMECQYLVDIGERCGRPGMDSIYPLCQGHYDHAKEMNYVGFRVDDEGNVIK